MEKHSTEFVGLDVHKESTAIGRAGAGRAAGRFVGTVGPTLAELLKSLKSLGRPEELSIVYEAGPCGYGLVRELRTRGYACEVIAPSKIPRRSGDRVKTDRRDAVRLAELARAGELVSVMVPDERDEAIRDLSRARVDAVRARLAARHQLKAMLLRHGHRYGRSSWTQAHERYLAKITFAHAAQDATFAEYRQAVSEANERVQRLVEALRDQCTTWRMQPVLEALMTLRGIDFVAAVTLVAELGDLKRFAHPRELMSFLGLVPSEYTSGDSRHLGKITKAGNGHVRRILIEAAWNYRFPARMSVVLQKRQEGQPKVVRDIAWRAQLRLAHTGIGTRCAGHDVGNPRVRYVGILRAISDLRTRQPRDGQMKCGNQPAHISMINRRQSIPRVAFPFRCELRPIRDPRYRNPSADPRVLRLRLLTPRGHISVLYFPFRQTTLISPLTCRNKKNFCATFGTFVGLTLPSKSPPRTAQISAVQRLAQSNLQTSV